MALLKTKKSKKESSTRDLSYVLHFFFYTMKSTHITDTYKHTHTLPAQTHIHPMISLLTLAHTRRLRVVVPIRQRAL